MKKGSGFEKFYKNKEKTGGAKKEAIRKEKRDLRKEREEQIANAKRQKRAQYREGANQPPKYNLEPPKNRFQKQEGGPKGKPGFSPEKRNSRQGEGRPPAERRLFDGRQSDRPDRKPTAFGNRDNKPKFQKPDRPERPRSSDQRQPERSDRKQTPFTNRDSKPGLKKSYGQEKPRSFDGPKPANRNSSATPTERKFNPSPAANSKFTRQRPADENRPKAAEREGPKQRIPVSKAQPNASPTDLMPLNKYIAHSGICSRRDAVDLIKAGKVKVNGQLVVEPGQKVQLADDITVAGRRLTPVKDFVYILLNKPKDYITTTDDPQERRTVLDLLKGAPEEIRIYPVGRLDRNTSGVLLLTNDGDLSQKLTHPSNEIKKVYAVTLEKPLTRAHFDDILSGVELEDGPTTVDSLAYTDTKDLTQIGVEIHSGRNRIVRRIFEHFGYEVKALDRVMFAGLTKKNVNRGKWRYLNEREVRDLKFFRKGR